MKILFILLFAFLSHNILSQEINKESLNEILNELKSGKNDSSLINQYSILPYEVYNIDRSYLKDSLSIGFLQLVNSDVNQILGPFLTDTSIIYTKTISIDSAFIVHVGNIWIDINRGSDEARVLAYEILEKVKNGNDFNTYCILYSDDRNINKDCEIERTFNTNFVEPFATEVLKHSKNEVFVVETKYGFHVVKILENAYEDRKSVNYIKLELKK